MEQKLLRLRLNIKGNVPYAKPNNFDGLRVNSIDTRMGYSCNYFVGTDEEYAAYREHIRISFGAKVIGEIDVDEQFNEIKD